MMRGSQDSLLASGSRLRAQRRARGERSALAGRAMVAVVAVVAAAAAMATAAQVCAAGGRRAPPPPASAASFEELAAEARVPVALGTLLSALDARCPADDDLARRRCEGVRSFLVELGRGGRFLVEGDSAALRLLPFDATAKTADLELDGCIACASPLPAGEGKDGGRYLTSRAPTSVEAGRLLGLEVARRALPFAEASLARTFAEELLPLLRAELVFSLEGAAWARDGLRGHIFRLLGYRVHNRCSGEVLMASPVSKAEAGGLREPGTCPKPRAVVAQPKGPPAVDLPLRLSSAELQKVVGGRGQQMDACYERFQIAGLARIALEVAGDGSVRDIRVHGTFEGTPTAACLIEALRALSFPKFRSPSIKVEVPIILPR